jgi:hypothetical protein
VPVTVVHHPARVRVSLTVRDDAARGPMHPSGPVRQRRTRPARGRSSPRTPPRSWRHHSGTRPVVTASSNGRHDGMGTGAGPGRQSHVRTPPPGPVGFRSRWGAPEGAYGRRLMDQPHNSARRSRPSAQAASAPTKAATPLTRDDTAGPAR